MSTNTTSVWRKKLKELEIVVVIPTYNNGKTLAAVIEEVCRYADDIIVVNDGSTDDTANILEQYPAIRTITHPVNKGKGTALKHGLSQAKKEGFRYAITIDSDGQHFASDIPCFIEAIEKEPDTLLVGARNLASDNMPGKNTFANKFSNFWFRLETGLKLEDTQSGYRLYPLRKMNVQSCWYTAKYEFELEAIVFAAWGDVAVKNIPIHVYYPPQAERVSHFRPFRDFTRISVLNTVLVLITCLWIVPRNLLRKLSWSNCKRFFTDHVLNTRESNLKIVLAIMLGIFMGIVPLWGYQMLITLFLAHLFRLNKVIALVAANISIPPMIPLLLYGSYRTGCMVLGNPPDLHLGDLSLENVKSVLEQYLIGSIIFAMACSLLSGVISTVLLAICRRKTDMTKFFVGLYNYFERHKVLFYLSLSVCILFMALFAAQVRFEENVTSFFPDTKDSQNAINVFENLKIKDKIMIMLSGKDGVADADSLIEAAETIKQDLQQQAEGTLIKEIFSKADENLINSAGDFVYDNLPLFLSDEDYQRLDTLLTAGNIAALMQKNYSNLISPAGFALKNYIMRDPLGLGSQTLKHLQDFQLEANYELINEHIFSRDGSTLLMFITPVFNTGSTGKNDKLIRLIENELQKAEKEHPQLVAEYFGGPSVGVYNARQIKKDTLVTSSIALIIIIVFISLVFKHKKSIPLIITPVLFGALFALCLIYFIKGGISAIAVGAGSAVMGIALSYSIHMLAHQNHVSSVQQLIREIAYPLTVGSFTTIGAFFGLLFTSSNLLRDFGLFASLALIGTTLFCLVYLPHFLKGQAHVKQGAVLRFIEKLNAYPYEKNKGLVGGILVLTLICLFTSQNVRFNEDMMSLNYEPAHLKQSENKLAELFDKKEKTVLFVSTGKDMGDATGQYAETNRLLSQLKEEGKIKDYASAGQFLIPEEVQEARLKQWHNYWTPEKKARLRETIRIEAARYHFREHAFEPFFQWLDRPFQPLDYQNEITTRLLNEWQTSADSLTMLITQVRMNETDKEAVYPLFQPKEKVVIFDRGYFANQWVSAVNQDFYLILYISSFLIFFALWISYGRIELTLMSFLPMLVSWIIIVGLMGMLGIEFNIINIILSTFIFGIGDDFSIFIMDGLQNKYRTGRQLLNSHKTAIFFSAFTTVIGMGTLVFARHPALQSISLISILGMIAVVLIAYTLQPILFRFFITAPASKGLPPYTLTGLARTGGLFLLFFIGCLFLRLLITVMTLLPIRKAYKKQVLCQLIHVTCKGLIHIATFVHKEKINRTGETFKKPAILIANHQSFIDILVLLALTPKLVMVTNHWVWHSPFFGAIIRYADFYYVGDGYELYVERMRQKVKEGYSIAIFPEGTRTYDGRMKRFHKGAFYLSEKLQLDIIPVILYGNCKIIAKAQPFNVRKGIMLTEILPRIPANDATYGTTYQERTKSISARMKKEYARICREQSTTDNPVFYENLIQNYIYKGPVEEWYIRIKVKMEDNYRLFNRLVPVKGQITDIGCGFGPLCYMLSQLSEEREITGIDYDEDKIAVAQYGWLRTPHLQFVCANALEYPLPESDAFILNDILHYMNYEHQRTLLLRCMEQLRPEGKLIVRDGNAANTRKHRLTRFTELLSTGIFSFNKTTEQLCFTSEAQIRSIAQEGGMQLEILPNDRYTSNTIYIFQKNKPEHE